MDAQQRIELMERHYGRPLDRYEQLIFRYGQISVAVLGAIVNGQPEFLLAGLGPEDTLSEGDRLKARLNNYYVAGCFSYRDGEADGAVEPDPDSWRVLVAAVPSFLSYLAEKLAPPVQDDSAAWCERLFQLRDERTEN